MATINKSAPLTAEEQALRAYKRKKRILLSVIGLLVLVIIIQVTLMLL